VRIDARKPPFLKEIAGAKQQAGLPKSNTRLNVHQTSHAFRVNLYCKKGNQNTSAVKYKW
jgi:rhodanese-related sulfurtransferase